MSISPELARCLRVFAARDLTTVPVAKPAVSGGPALQTSLRLHFGSQHDVAVMFHSDSTVHAVAIKGSEAVH